MNKIVPILVVLTLFTVGFILAYSQGWYPFTPSPEGIINQSFSKMASLDTLHYDAQIDWDMKFSEAALQESTDLTIDNMKINLRGDLDQSDSEKIKNYLDLGLVMGMEGMDLSLEGEVISLGDNKVYLKIISVPAPINSFLAMLGLDINKLKEQWILIESEEADSPERMNEELITKIKELLQDKELVTVKEKLADEEINGQMNYHYLASFNSESFKALIPELKEVLKEYGDSAGALEDSETEASIDNLLDRMKEKGLLDFEIWIGQQDGYIHRYKIDPAKNAFLDFYGDQKETIEELDAAIEINFSQFNQDLTIEEPAGAKTLEEIMGTSAGMTGESLYLEESLPGVDY